VRNTTSSFVAPPKFGSVAADPPQQLAGEGATDGKPIDR
jgi:hypothetical protein